MVGECSVYLISPTMRSAAQLLRHGRLPLGLNSPNVACHGRRSLGLQNVGKCRAAVETNEEAPTTSGLEVRLWSMNGVEFMSQGLIGLADTEAQIGWLERVLVLWLKVLLDMVVWNASVSVMHCARSCCVCRGDGMLGCVCDNMVSWD